MGTSQSNPFDQFDVPLAFKTENDMARTVAFSPGETPDTGLGADEPAANIRQINQELRKMKEGDPRRSVLEAELAKQGNPFDKFDEAPKPGQASKGRSLLDQLQPSAEAKQAPPKSFTDTLKNPMELMKDESIPAHLYNAYQKGTFNKPLGELISSASEAVKDFSLKQLWELAKERPGEFAGELVNSIVADPELLLAPIGLGGKIAKVMSFAGAPGRIAGRAVETGLVGGTMAAAGSIAQQLDEDGAVLPGQVMRDFGVGAAFGAALGTAVHLGADIKGIPAKEVYGKVHENLGKKSKGAGWTASSSDVVDAVDEALKDLDIPKETRDPLKDALKDKQAVDTQTK